MGREKALTGVGGTWDTGKLFLYQVCNSTECLLYNYLVRCTHTINFYINVIVKCIYVVLHSERDF